MAALDPLFLSTARVATFNGQLALTNASGFFFRRDARLFLVTSRHVLFDDFHKHYPDRLEIEVHVDAVDLTRSIGFSVLLYQNGVASWRQGRDSGGDVDVAVLELDVKAFPQSATVAAFTPSHLYTANEEVRVGEPLFVIGFPLGFHDSLHHLPVVRQAIVASPFGVRFQGQGVFLTDARTHRGTSGAPVVMRAAEGAALPGDLSWKLLGVHSSRMDMGNRDLVLDETLGLNSTWYADILMTLTAPQ